VTTATAIPSTYGELEGDEAFETLRAAGRRRLLLDSVARFRAADGFSHSRALAFQFTLTLLPALIALVGLAAVADQEEVRRIVEATVKDVAPGAAGDMLTEALSHGSSSSRRESGETAVVAGLIAAVVAGTSAMAAVERGANRIYGVERDRHFWRRYGIALALALTAGTFGLLSVIVLVGGAAIGEAIGYKETLGSIFHIARWPLGIGLVVGALALLFEVAPKRRQPEASWLAFGAGVSAVLWLLSMAALDVYVDGTNSFGATYGPIAGTIGVLLWTFLSSIALFGGLAFAAQLEAVRAGISEVRVDRDENLVQSDDDRLAGLA
jgi:YihY family inner membrane protein